MLWNAHYHCHCGSGMIHREIFEYPSSQSKAGSQANHPNKPNLGRLQQANDCAYPCSSQHHFTMIVRYT